MFFCLGGSSSFSQSDSPQKILVRFSPLGVIDFLDHNLTPGIEYRMYGRWAAGLDAGYIFASDYIAKNKGTAGVLMRPYVRFYPKSSSGLFLHAEFHYKRVRYRLEDWLGKAPVNGIPTYEEFTTFSYVKRVTGANLRIGGELFLSPNKRLRSEVTVGFGVRFKKSLVRDGVYTIGDIFNVRNVDPKKALPAIPLNFTMSYQLR